MKKQNKRYYPLVEEIKNHVFSWAVDEDWEGLPSGLQSALQMVMNELKIYETVKDVGTSSIVSQETEASKKRKFISIFKKLYVEACGFDFSASITPVNQVNIARVIKNVEESGGTYAEFLDWFFNDFCSIESNKKFYMPPEINKMCTSTVVTKFLYEKKDTLARRKSYINNAALKAAILNIAIPLTERTKCKELSQKLLDFSDEKIPVMKFFDIIKNFAAKLSDTIALQQCSELEGNSFKEQK